MSKWQNLLVRFTGRRSISEVYDEFLHGSSSCKRTGSTLKKYQYDFYPFVEKYGKLTPNQITPEIVGNWFVGLKQIRKFREATMAKHRGLFNAFFNYCIREGYCTENPADKLPVYSDKPSENMVLIPRERDVQRVVETAKAMTQSQIVTDRRNGALMGLSYVYGNRRGELKNLSWVHFWNAIDNPIEIEPGLNAYVLTSVGKTGSSTLAVGDLQRDMLCRYLEMAPEPLDDSVFMNLNSHHARYRQRLSDTGMGRARKAVLKRADVQRLTFQEMRRYRGTQIGREYGPEIASLVLGHRTGTQVLRDFYYNPDNHAAIVAAIKSLKF